MFLWQAPRMELMCAPGMLKGCPPKIFLWGGGALAPLLPTMYWNGSPPVLLSSLFCVVGRNQRTCPCKPRTRGRAFWVAYVATWMLWGLVASFQSLRRYLGRTSPSPNSSCTSDLWSKNNHINEKQLCFGWRDEGGLDVPLLSSWWTFMRCWGM